METSRRLTQSSARPKFQLRQRKLRQPPTSLVVAIASFVSYIRIFQQLFYQFRLALRLQVFRPSSPTRQQYRFIRKRLRHEPVELLLKPLCK